MKWSDIGKMKFPFWLTCFSCMLIYIGVVNAVNVGYTELMVRFNFDDE